MSIKKWNIAELDKGRASEMAEKWELPFFLSMMLDIRGITNEDEVNSFLSDKAALSNPMDFIDMDKAVERIETAIDRFEKICIYGDYDADGITSTALLYSYLESRGANVVYYIPERDLEGYGLNLNAMDRLHEDNISLIITVDNGIVSVDEVDYANSLGIDVVVTDHHRPRDVLPNAVAVVDPYREDCPSKFKDFAGVGVVFKLICALEGEEMDTAQLLENYSDLVAIGTVADIVSLTGENRTLVKEGMKYIRNMDRPGIQALLVDSGLDDKKITSGNISFVVIPRINAGGRISSSNRAVKLLLCEEQDLADEIAQELGEENLQRRAIEHEITEQVIQSLKDNPKRLLDRVLVIDGQDWHQGVIGIVSSKITEKYGKPSIIIARSDGESKGSGRSVAGFSLCDAIAACGQYLTRFGGHPMAAGLNMDSKNIEDFRKAINEYAKSVSEDMPDLTLNIDCKLNPAALSADIVNQIEFLEPFGSGNTTPVFALMNMTLDNVTPVGGGRHLRLLLSRGGSSVTVMQFSTTPEMFSYQEGDTIDVAVTLGKSEYRGQENLSIIAKDIKLSDMDIDYMLGQRKLYEKIKRKEPVDDSTLDEAIPHRDEFASVYRFLRDTNGWTKSVYILHYRLNNCKISLIKLIIILDIMNELGLINIDIDGDIYNIVLNSVTKKVDLESSSILKQLRCIRRSEE